MNLKEILKPKKRIFGGTHIPHFKNTADDFSVVMPPPDTVVIPLKQHIGVPCDCLVKKGDSVLVGTKIGDSKKPLSSPVFSSVSGVVKEITEIGSGNNRTHAVIIESDGLLKEEKFTKPVISSAEDLVRAARDCGLVGLGGAGFPTHIKLSSADNKNIDTLIINAAECEPFITSDYRTCIEDFNDVIDGVYTLLDIFKFDSVIIAVEKNKPKAIEKLLEIASSRRDTENKVKIMQLSTRYPQGAEKTLVYTVTGRKIPFGKLPADVGCVVMNVTSIAVLAKYIKTGKPLVSKRITVDGSAVSNPQNLIVPIGTKIGDVLEFCNAEPQVSKIIYGGPMMGVAISDTDAPVMKQNNAVLAFKEPENNFITPCIRCGKCAAACPIRLNPASVDRAIKFSQTDTLENLNVNYCIECGCCSYTCPAHRPLTQTMRQAKAIIKGAVKNEQ